MVDFIQLFAPHITSRQLDQLGRVRDQDAIDTLFGGTDLPLRGGCGDKITAAA